MKKLYILAVAGLLAGGVFGQQIQKRASFGNEMNNHVRALKQAHSNGSMVAKSGASAATSALHTGYIDYSWFAANDLSYVWQFNSLYTAADTSFNYICVALNQFGVFDDYADNSLDVDYMGQNVWPATMTIDSVFVLMTQENNSSTYDKVGLNIIKLNSSGNPTTSSAILYSYLDSTNVTLSPGGGWVGTGASFVWGIAPNYTVNLATDKVGLNFIYRGPDADTCGVIGSSIDDGSGGTMTQATYNTSWMRYPPYITSISRNNSIGYGSPVGSAGWIEVQDWEIWAKVTFDDATVGYNALNKNEFKVYQNAPNPFSGKTTIRYTVGKNASEIKFHLYDLTGRMIMDKTESDVASGDYSMVIDGNLINKGVYLYSFEVDGVKMTKRMVIE
jgi:hypothetical protein